MRSGTLNSFKLSCQCRRLNHVTSESYRESSFSWRPFCQQCHEQGIAALQAIVKAGYDATISRHHIFIFYDISYWFAKSTPSSVSLQHSCMLTFLYTVRIQLCLSEVRKDNKLKKQFYMHRTKTFMLAKLWVATTMPG